MLINGVYRDGVFHPTEPVELADNTPVTMAVNAKHDAEVTQVESDADREQREIHEILVAAGVVRPGPIESTIPKKRRAEIAQQLAKAGPIYDIIREERDAN